jgi:DNA polymerase I-like protein with 3'-5' exonuclease and polymerase domains
MRHDSEGLFWQDIEVIKPVKTGEKQKAARVMPSIPETGWKLRDFPNLTGITQIAIDTETYDPKIFETGPGWATGDGFVAGISIATEDQAWYFPIGHTVGENQDKESVLNFVRQIAEDEKTEKIFANAMYDIGWLSNLNISVKGVIRDIQIAEPLLDEHAFSYSLNALSEKYLGETKTEDSLYRWASRAYGGNPDRKQAGNIWRCPPTLVGPYAEADASLAIRVWNCQKPLLKKADLDSLFELESALIPILFKMRKHGVRIDLDKAKLADDALSQRIETIEKSLDGLNIYAATDVEKLAKKRGLKYPTTTTGKPSFRSKWLEENIPEVAECRKLTKARDTFIRSYILESHVNGRLFGQFHPLRSDDSGTVSGRFSSSTPNLQNIPARDPELGPLIRSIFVPDLGHQSWGSFDYSQIEYRMLVHYGTGESAELARSQYYTDPKTDFHEFVSNLTGVPRKEAKNINFGLVYGMGERALAKNLGRELSEVKPLFDQYHSQFPFVKDIYNLASQRASQRGFIRTFAGRYARFNLYEPLNDHDGETFLPYDQALEKWGPRIRRSFTHKALNRLLQGSAADLIKMAMVAIHKAGLMEVVPMLLTVHDELDFSIEHTQEVKEAVLEIIKLMTGIPGLKVPLLVDAEFGKSWGEVQ